MLKKALLLILSCYLFSAKAQFSDSFSDSNFTFNPTWIGQDTNFKVDTNILQLRLNAPSATSQSFLSTNSNSINNASWQFTTWLDFNPSGSNLAKVHLTSNVSDLTGTGYFVMIGNSSDDVSLYRQTGGSTTKIIDGADGLLNTSSPKVSIRVERDSLGNWSLYSDTSSSGAFVLEGIFNDLTHTTSNYFGVQCKYTSSRSDKFYFDGFVVTGSAIKDKTPPVLDSLQLIYPNQLKLFFNEALDVNLAQTNSNYTFSSFGQPISSTLNGINLNVVDLTFTGNYQNNTTYNLLVSNIADSAGNVMASANKSATYFVADIPQYRDVVINEFMADPSPPSSLPDAEFIELWNYSNNYFDLKNWLVGDNTTLVKLPQYYLAPYEFVIICSKADSFVLSPYGNLISVSSMPSLNNTSDQIRLKSNTGLVVDSIEYSDSWYNDDLKDDGGFSLELISPHDKCKTNPQNYIASALIDGGSPGLINTVFDTLNNQPPVISFASINDDLRIELSFSNQMDSSIYDVSNYTIQGMGNVLLVQNGARPFQDVILVSQTVLESHLQYTVNISQLLNCHGQIISDTSISLAKGGNPKQFDVVVSEVYANPNDVVSPNLPFAEYVEIQNATDQFLRLDSFYLKDVSTWGVLPAYTLAPSEIAVLCDKSEVLKFDSENTVLGLDNWPSLNNSSDAIELVTKDSNMIHSVNYSDEWYKDENKEDGGYSLEMMDINNPCEGSLNWTGSNDKKGGTPGLENSVKENNPDYLGPYIIRYRIKSQKSVHIEFDGIIIVDETIQPSIFVENFNASSILWKQIEPNKMEFEFIDTFKFRTTYNIQLQNIFDCVGNESNAEFIEIGRAETATVSDVIVNEIMTNPISSTGTDYVELYNKSDKFINLKDWKLANWNVEKDTIGSVKIISINSETVLPQSFVLISKSTNEIFETYPYSVDYSASKKSKFLTIEALPSYPNDEGSVLLINTTGSIFDRLDYTEEMHLALIKNTDGVALERISYDNPTNQSDNWTSASENQNFGTPGYENSQLYAEIEVNDPITVTPDIFSPDNDGYNDVLGIHYQFDITDQLANFSLHNTTGVLVKILETNYVLGTNGTLYWDGITEDNLKAKIGIYFLFFQVFDLEGNTKVYKKTFVVGGKF